MTVFSDDWTGTNGDPWDSSKWTTSVIGSATVDIQGNEGRMLMNGNQTRGRAVADHSPIGDSEVLVKVQASAVGSLFNFITLRGDGQWVTTDFQTERPFNGYVLQRTIAVSTQGPGLFFVKMLDGVRTTMGTLIPWVADTDPWWIRYEVFDSNGSVFLRFKHWADGTSEPGSWALTFEDTDASHSSGILQLSTLRGASGSRSIFWDDLTLNAEEEVGLVRVQSEGLNLSEGDLKFLAEQQVLAGDTGWGIPVGI